MAHANTQSQNATEGNNRRITPMEHKPRHICALRQTNTLRLQRHRKPNILRQTCLAKTEALHCPSSRGSTRHRLSLSESLEIPDTWHGGPRRPTISMMTTHKENTQHQVGCSANKSARMLTAALFVMPPLLMASLIRSTMEA